MMERTRRGLLALGILIGLAAQGALAQTPAPSDLLPEADPKILSQLRAPDLRRSTVSRIPLPTKPVVLPRVNEKNSFGLVVTPPLATAYQAYMAGDGDAALAALDRADAAGGSAAFRWHLSFQRAQTLIMMGRASEAEEVIQRVAALEIQTTGKALNTRALRGESRLWLGDTAGAIADLALVSHDLRNWRFQTNYSAEPSAAEIVNMVAQTTAQLRAYGAMAAALLLRGDVASALPWLEETEQRYNDVHFVTSHPEYGRNLPLHPDSWYGRAVNLSFLGTARVISRRDPAAGAEFFESAARFYQAVGYVMGGVSVQALRAWSFAAIGRPAEAERVAAEALAAALALDAPDIVWRLETVRGEALLALGRADEAEQAFRRAQAAVDEISGALSTDRAKRRYGVGKEDITYRLVKFDAARGDLAALFEDMERGRARAFVDLLADRLAQENGAYAARLRAVRAVDREIVKARIVAGAPIAGARADIASLHAVRAARLAEVRVLAPELADALSVATHSMAAVQKGLAPGAVLAYVLPARDAETLSVLVVGPDNARLSPASLTAAGLRGLLQRFADAVQQQDSARQESLVGELATGLGVNGWGAQRMLYVVPSGDTHFIPWGALPVATPVVVLPLGGWLLRSAPVDGPPQPAVVLGDPDLGPGIAQLPGARVEAAEVARRFGATPLVGATATESNLRRAIGPGAGVLHLATHGLFDAENPLQSAIYLAGERAPRRLTAGDLVTAPLMARLLVLSACETGLGAVTAGDDYLGLARSLYLGGTQAIVHSLWPVEDEGTRRFMTAFHDALTSGDAGTAWLAARDATRAAGLPPAVYGAFVLGGSATVMLREP